MDGLWLICDLQLERQAITLFVLILSICIKARSQNYLKCRYIFALSRKSAGKGLREFRIYIVKEKRVAILPTTNFRIPIK